MRIKIEGGGHAVEIDQPPADYNLVELAKIAEDVFMRTRTVGESPRVQMGFAGQLIERVGDSPVHGNGAYEYKPSPVTGGGSLPRRAPENRP